MMAALRSWLISVTVVTLLISLVQTLVPEGTLRKISSFAGGLILLAVLVQPLPGGERVALVFNISEYATQLDAQRQVLEEAGQEALGEEVARLTAAAIEEKAAEWGLQVSAKVETAPDGDDGTPLPSAVTLKGEYSEALAEWIEEELGISTAAQTWRT